jgi:hypothetical protein
MDLLHERHGRSAGADRGGRALPLTTVGKYDKKALRARLSSASRS